MGIFEELLNKYQIGNESIKYKSGNLNLIYSIEERKLLGKVSRYLADKDFAAKQNLHEEKIMKKLKEKGYPVPKSEGVFRIFEKNRRDYVPGLVMEDLFREVPLRAVPEIYYGYFKDFYREVLNNVERDGFSYGDVNEGNCLCDLKNKNIFLIDFGEWEYFGKDEKILSPIRE
jgi:RIO-like serine/threonine protein kinase